MNRRQFLSGTAAAAMAALAGCGKEEDESTTSEDVSRKLIIKGNTRQIIVFPGDNVVCYQTEHSIGYSGHAQRGCVQDEELAEKYERVWRERGNG